MIPTYLRTRCITYGRNLIVVFVCALAGCGTEKSPTAVSKKRAFVARANDLCTKYNQRIYSLQPSGEGGRFSIELLAQRQSEAAQLRALIRNYPKLPGGTRYDASLKAAEEWLSFLAAGIRKHIPYSQSYAKKSRMLYVRVSEDESALGLVACLEDSTRAGVSNLSRPVVDGHRAPARR